MNGLAAEWRNNKMEEFDKTPALWNNYDKFIKTLEKDWGEIDKLTTALSWLMTAKKNKGKLLNQWIAEVDRKISEAKITDEGMKNWIMTRTLPPQTQIRVRSGAAITTYNDLKE